MRRKYERYSEEFKLSVVRDYYSCGMSKYACVKKYNLSSGRVLNLWLLAYDKAENPLSLPSEPLEEDMPNRNKDSYKDENQELKKRIRELEKALEFSRLETKVRDMMIDKAEEYFNIPIRKKSGAKKQRNWSTITTIRLRMFAGYLAIVAKPSTSRRPTFKQRLRTSVCL